MSKLDLAFRMRSLRLLALAAIGVSAGALAVPGVQARAHRHAPAAVALDVQPFPGTPDAAPQTGIEFPALAPAQIKAVVVTGSRSGSHSGRLTALPGGHGSQFVPLRQFTDGEHVSVRATLRSPAAGTASGAPGARRISFSFGIAVPASTRGLVGAVPASGSLAGGPTARAAQDTNGITHTFYSASSLHPPIVSLTGKDPDPAQGDILGDVENSVQAGPLILDPNGALVYFQPTSHSAAFNVQVQNYLGQSVLTYFQGYVPNEEGYGIGHDVMLNHQYQVVANVYAGNGYSADLHEFTITRQGDALITAYSPVWGDLRSVGGPRWGEFLDSIIQEVNISTGKVLWEWHAYGHVHLAETYAGKPHGGARIYDPYHINSVQPLPNGNLLVSMRHTWALYEVNMKTGRIPFNIGGKRSSFRTGRQANFEWQHHAHMYKDNSITVFDNASDGPLHSERQSRALRLWLDFKNHTVYLIKQFRHRPATLSGSQGSVQPLADGNWFVGWGASPYYSELDRWGEQLFSLHVAGKVQSYRGLRFKWWGQPTTPPSLAAKPSAQGTFLFASWNGATTVSSWRVLAGPSASSLKTVGQYPKTFFETIMWVRNTQPYFEVQALDSSGNVLGTSPAVQR